MDPYGRKPRRPQSVTLRLTRPAGGKIQHASTDAPQSRATPTPCNGDYATTHRTRISANPTFTYVQVLHDAEVTEQADASRPAMKPMTRRSEAAVVAGAVALTGGILTVAIFWIRASLDPGTLRVQLEAVRTALTFGASAGGGIALWLAVRRQRSTELDLTQKEVSAGDQRPDAAERRITEIYTKAAEQLGADNFTMRMAGIHALERLAKDYPAMRQTVTDLLCSYIRMTPQRVRVHPIEDLSNSRSISPRNKVAGRARKAVERGGGLAKEHEDEALRMAQRVLLRHLVPKRAEPYPEVGFTAEDDPRFWGDLDIDLSGTTLNDFNFKGCRVANADFCGSTFIGDHSFEYAEFTGEAKFDGAKFKGDALFFAAKVKMVAGFSLATFEDYARFEEFNVEPGSANFDSATFDGLTWFEDARFGYVSFREAHFSRESWWHRAYFASSADFYRTAFNIKARFEGCHFSGLGQIAITSDVPSLDGATVGKVDKRKQSWPRSVHVKNNEDGAAVLKQDPCRNLSSDKTHPDWADSSEASPGHDGPQPNKN